MNLWKPTFTICFGLLALFGCKSTDSASDVKFYGTDSRRAEMTFSNVLYFNFPAGYTGNVADLYSVDLKDEIDQAIKDQLAFMFGAFSGHTKPFNFQEKPGIPRERPVIKFVKAERVRGKQAAYVYYDYEDVAVFKKDLFHGANQEKIEFLLPKDPYAIYSKGLIPIATALDIYRGDDIATDDLKHLKKQGETQANLCTDLHYNSEGDFWYFWNPYQKGCTQSTRDNLVKVTANLKPRNSTANSYPRYGKLYGDNGNGDVLRITYLIGVDENFRNSDEGVKGYKKTVRMLTEGKKLLALPNAAQYLTVAETEMLKKTPDNEDIIFTMLRDENRHKSMRYQANGFKVLLNIYLVDPNKPEFDQMAVDGLRNADVFIYDGHSGLGGYLSVGRLFASRRYTIPADKYQIFFFNGCSTFSYYNHDFFQLKVSGNDPRGMKNLDIVTTSSPAVMTIGPGTDSFLIRMLVDGKKKSWQQIIDAMYKISGEDSAMINVNGDEANPRNPDEI